MHFNCRIAIRNIVILAAVLLHLEAEESSEELRGAYVNVRYTVYVCLCELCVFIKKIVCNSKSIKKIIIIKYKKKYSYIT